MAASASWTASTWQAVSKYQYVSLKKTIQGYKGLSQRLKAKLDQLTQKREELDNKAFVVVEEIPVAPSAVGNIQNAALSDNSSGESSPFHPHHAPLLSPSPTSGQQHSEDTPSTSSEPVSSPRLALGSDYHHGNQSSLASTATNILIESVQIRLNYVTETINYLTALYHENPKAKVPPELMLARYEEWVQTNQRLFQLNSRLYDLEKLKFDLQKKEERKEEEEEEGGGEEEEGVDGDASPARGVRNEFDKTTSQLVRSNATRIQAFLSRYPSHAPSTTTQTYLQEVLTQRGDRTTLEAQKVQEYVSECLQNSHVDLDNITGAHPQSYQQFMAVLCNFMVERQREVQGEYLSLSMVYSAVEHIVMPQIQSVVWRYVQQADRDRRIQEQCQEFSDVTLQQLSIRPQYWSKELEPFIESISQLRATYFSPTPTDKMSAVVGAAKALYDQLSTMGEDSIDGDSFLDLWVYAIIKANIPDLASNIEFMSQYGNPALGMDEAGYYLTTLSVAANFIEHKLSRNELKQPSHPEKFVFCEREKVLRLCETAGSCFQLESEREELAGYRVAVIKDWVLNKARLFCSALLYTGDPKDVAVVSVIKASSEGSTAAMVEYFVKKLLEPELDLSGLSSHATPHGAAVVLDPQKTDHGLYFALEEGDYEKFSSQCAHVLQLIRLGSRGAGPQQGAELGGDGEGGDIYTLSPTSEGYEESLGHRPLSQQLNYDDDSTDSSDHTLLRSLPTPSSATKGRSKTHSSGVGRVRVQRSGEDEDGLGGGGSFKSHSPYLLSYSPLRKNVADHTHGQGGGRSGREERSATHTTASRWGFQKLRSISSASKRSSDVPLDEMDSRHTSPFHIPQLTVSEAPPTGHTPDTEGYYDDKSSADRSWEKLPGRKLQGNLSKSENFLSRPEDDDDDDTTHLLDGRKSPSLRRLRNSLLARLSFGRKHSSARDSPERSPALTVPASERQRRVKVRSKTASGLEETYPQPAHSKLRNSGGFVMVMKKEPEGEEPEEFLGEEHVKRLEENFRLNHMFGSLAVDVRDGMRNIIKQGQVYLQQLNFLSVGVAVDGVYSDLMVLAVRCFQESHNKHERGFSPTLMEDGHLTPVTFQYLRQAYLTLYASMFRLGLLNNLGEGFDPTSTLDEDVRAFRNCVSAFQQFQGVACRHYGLLCTHTIASISQCLLSKTRTRTHGGDIIMV